MPSFGKSWIDSDRCRPVVPRNAVNARMSGARTELGFEISKQLFEVKVEGVSQIDAAHPAAAVNADRETYCACEPPDRSIQDAQTS